MNLNIDAAIILAILSLIGTIVSGLFQFRKDRAETTKADAEKKRVEVESFGNVAEVAMKLSKQEFEALREVNKILTDRNTFLTQQLQKCQEEKEDLLEKHESKKEGE